VTRGCRVGGVEPGSQPEENDAAGLEICWSSEVKSGFSHSEKGNSKLS
jgi:hypothetical protein